MTIQPVAKKDAIFVLAENLASLKYEDIPAEAVQATKMDILDTLGVSIAASGTAPSCGTLAELVKEIGGKEESTIISFGGKVPAPMAAFVNATLAHALNFDDVNDGASLHIACSVFPAAFAVSERMGKVNGKEFITAYTLAMDLESRLARAIVGAKAVDRILQSYLLGQVFGYFGAAAAAGRLLKLNKEQLVNAFGLVYSQVAGPRQVFFGGADKGIYPAYPAQAGVLSALMAQRGIAGTKDSLEGKAGLYNVYFFGQYDASALTKDLGRSFEAPGFYRFPCCSLTHPAIELMLRMKDEHKLRPTDVEAITVSAGGKVENVCEPLELRRNPQLTSEAQFSIPFTVATALVKGTPRIEHFIGNGFRDPEILRISNTINWRLDSECALHPGSGAQTTKIEIKLRNGRLLSGVQSELRRGHSENPLSKEELIDKFKDCTRFSTRPLPTDRIQEVIQMANELEDLDNVNRLIQLVS